MWICLNDSFVSIVEDTRNPDQYLVRGRRLTDVINFIKPLVVGVPPAIVSTPRSDYHFRCTVSKEELQKCMMATIDKIDYPNFKDIVADVELERFYMETWVAGVRNLDPDWEDRVSNSYKL